jgi:hypothetical protein
MTDTIYLYPKSSCPCNECAKSYPGHQGLRMNVCDNSKYYDCYNRLELKNNSVPQKKSGYDYLNLQVWTDKIDPHFDTLDCSKCTDEVCPDKTVVSRDPRQFNAMTAQLMSLDTAPINGSVKLKNIYSKKYDDYGIGYKPYTKINDGQIVYYVDRSIEDAFFKPVFSDNSIQQTVMFADPMGAKKPEYTRIPKINTQNPVIEQMSPYPDCLSFIQDTQSFREDIMGYQMRKQNQFRFSPLWSVSK